MGKSQHYFQKAFAGLVPGDNVYEKTNHKWQLIHQVMSPEYSGRMSRKGQVHGPAACRDAQIDEKKYMMREEEEAERSSDLAMELDRQRAVAAYEVRRHAVSLITFPTCWQHSRNLLVHAIVWKHTQSTQVLAVLSGACCVSTCFAVTSIII